MTVKYDPTIQKLVDKAEAEAARARPGAARAPAREKGRRYHREALDPDESAALMDWVYNTQEWAPNAPAVNANTGRRNQGRAIAENLARKLERGTYDREKAWKAWLPIVEIAAKDLKQSEGGTFNPATREHAARDIARQFEGEVRRGEWSSDKRRRGR